MTFADAIHALDRHRTAARLEPKNPMHALRVADCLVRLGRVNEALPVYRRVAERYAAEGRHARALAAYRIVQRLFPRDPIAARRVVELARLRAQESDSRSLQPRPEKAPTTLAALEQTVRDLLADLVRTRRELDALKAEAASAVEIETDSIAFPF
jgi:hypothetical protein